MFDLEILSQRNSNFRNIYAKTGGNEIEEKNAYQIIWINRAKIDKKYLGKNVTGISVNWRNHNDWINKIQTGKDIK